MPLALATLAPPFLLVAYVSTLLVRRELTILVGLIGQLGCEGVNLALKRTFKQGRPTDFLGTGYGMPSSHSQFAGYFAVFWLCHLLRFRPGMARRAAQRRQGAQSKRANNRVWSLIDVIRSAEHYLLISLVLAGCTIVPYSRCSTKCCSGSFCSMTDVAAVITAPQIPSFVSHRCADLYWHKRRRHMRPSVVLHNRSCGATCRSRAATGASGYVAG